MLLSVVIPVYNEEESIPELLEWIFRVVDQHKIRSEVLLIDDGSTDSSWSVIASCSKKDPRVKAKVVWTTQEKGWQRTSETGGDGGGRQNRGGTEVKL